MRQSSYHMQVESMLAAGLNQHAQDGRIGSDCTERATQDMGLRLDVEVRAHASLPSHMVWRIIVGCCIIIVKDQGQEPESIAGTVAQ
jgi:hypothetical protein